MKLPAAVGTITLGLGVICACGPDPEIDIQEFQTALMRADKIVVLRGNESSQIVFKSEEFEDIEAFRKVVAIDPAQGQFYCACLGSPIIRLFSGETEILTITNHHGRSIRSSLWASNVRLRDVDGWVNWFHERGIPEPKEELEHSVRLAQQAEAGKKRWLEGMPPEVVSLWSQTNISSMNVDLEPFRDVLKTSYPDRYVRILVLLEWYGSGAGPWSGFPAYEDYVQDLLFDYSTPEVLTAIEGEILTERQTEGAARLLGGWRFGKRRPNDRSLIPAELKSRLLEHALQSDDEDKQSRAIAAFRSE